MLNFLVNPAARSGDGTQVWSKIENYLQTNHIRHQDYFLKEPGQAGRIARDLTSGEKKNVIVVVGGDGTVNECLNGIVDYQKCIFGLIPAGSANDLALSLGLPSDPVRILQMILAPEKVRALNIGQLSLTPEGSGRTEKNVRSMSRFIVSSGIGFDAAICYENSRNVLKPMFNRINIGKLSYTFTAVKELLTLKPMRLFVCADSGKIQTFSDTYFAVAMNARYEGGGYPFCPDADPSDDKLDLMIAEGLPKPAAFFAIPAAKFGLHVRLKGVHILRCSRASVWIGRQDDPACVHTDGEHAGFSHMITWTVAEEKLRMIVG